MFQPFSRKRKLFLQSCPEKIVRFLCEFIKNLLKGNLQSIKRHHVAKFPEEFRLLSIKRTTWNQRSDVLASEKGAQLLKVITPPIKNHLSWYGAFSTCSCFCVQQNFDYPVSYKAESSKVSTFIKSHVPSWFTQEGVGDKQKFFFQSRLFSRQNIVLSTYQALNFTNFSFWRCGNWNFPVEFCSTSAS